MVAQASACEGPFSIPRHMAVLHRSARLNMQQPYFLFLAPDQKVPADKFNDAAW
jgi:hypothetical protein